MGWQPQKTTRRNLQSPKTAQTNESLHAFWNFCPLLSFLIVFFNCQQFEISGNIYILSTIIVTVNTKDRKVGGKLYKKNWEVGRWLHNHRFQDSFPQIGRVDAWTGDALMRRCVDVSMSQYVNASRIATCWRFDATMRQCVGRCVDARARWFVKADRICSWAPIHLFWSLHWNFHVLKFRFLFHFENWSETSLRQVQIDSKWPETNPKWYETGAASVLVFNRSRAPPPRRVKRAPPPCSIQLWTCVLFHVPFKFATNRNKLLKTTGWGFAGIISILKIHPKRVWDKSKSIRNGLRPIQSDTKQVRRQSWSLITYVRKK